MRQAGKSALLAFGALSAVGSVGALFLVRARYTVHERHHHPRSEVRSRSTTSSADRGDYLIDLQNARCPTCSDAVDGCTFADWRGVRVGLSHARCEADFHADPTRALDASGLEWQAAAAAVESAGDLTGSAREQALDSLRSRWRIIPKMPEPLGD